MPTAFCSIRLPSPSRRLPGFAAILTWAALLPTTCRAEPPTVRWNAPPEEWHWVIPVPIPGMQHHTVKSASMDREIGYNIYLPPSYESATDRRFPVVYYLHGASGSELSAYEGAAVRRLIQDGRIGDVVYVFPNGGHFSKYRDWDNAHVKAETWIIRELIPHIDQTYRTIASREGRALTGWSMGGDASLRFVCKYPEMFCAAATVSAAVDWGAPRDGDDTIFSHSQANADKLRGRTGLLMVVGEDDNLFAPHQRLRPHLDKLKLDYTFQSYPGIGHNLGQMKQKCEEEIILMLARHYAAAR